MHSADILIPTCKDRPEIAALLSEIEATVTGHPRVIATCEPVCAAANRNLALDMAETSEVIMIDDDLTGFPAGWNEGMLEALRTERDAVVVSARLLDKSGKPGQMLGNPEDRPGEIVEVARRELPTACIAFRADGLRFDEAFVGSGWEDTHWCAALRVLYPEGRFLVHCGVRVTHLNEMKAQGVNFARNKRHFEETWGRHPHY